MVLISQNFLFLPAYVKISSTYVADHPVITYDGIRDSILLLTGRLWFLLAQDNAAPLLEPMKVLCGAQGITL